ncbi:MAG: DUF4258 domain-containing protein [Defluviitaleaceae bacterium]|nr:DUF4258 domain-containing protein [Defluviitaleaceae bacterium]
MYDIESIQALYENHAVEYSQHFRIRMKERKIKFSDVKLAIQGGEIIAQDLQDIPNPSILVLGYVRDNEPMHVAIGVGDAKLVLITAYFPTLALWEADYKTRKAADWI